MDYIYNFFYNLFIPQKQINYPKNNFAKTNTYNPNIDNKRTYAITNANTNTNTNANTNANSNINTNHINKQIINRNNLNNYNPSELISLTRSNSDIYNLGLAGNNENINIIKDRNQNNENYMLKRNLMIENTKEYPVNFNDRNMIYNSKNKSVNVNNNNYQFFNQQPIPSQITMQNNYNFNNDLQIVDNGNTMSNGQFSEYSQNRNQQDMNMYSTSLNTYDNVITSENTRKNKFDLNTNRDQLPKVVGSQF